MNYKLMECLPHLIFGSETKLEDSWEIEVIPTIKIQTYLQSVECLIKQNQITSLNQSFLLSFFMIQVNQFKFSIEVYD